MSTRVDFTDVAVVDNHCHSVERTQGQPDVAQWRALFTESPDQFMRTQAVTHTVFYQRLMTQMGLHYGTDADEAAILQKRGQYDVIELTGRLFTDAGVGALVVDTGYPDPSVALPVQALAATGSYQAVQLLRLELVLQELIVRSSTYDELLDAVRDRLAGARAKGFAGFKSIAAYRTGLAIARWPKDAASAAFAEARQEVHATGGVRLGHKPLLDSLLHVAFEVAAAEQLPVQFHVGYGDPDADLRNANPLLLRAVLEEAPYRGMSVVLLHSCWPFVREGAFLAAVYGNAFLDLSYGIPFLSRQEMRSMTRAALAAAPTNKLMYSSDGARVPELHWLGARDGRRLLGEVLGELIDDGDLTQKQARRAGEQVLRDNARAMYGLGDVS